MLNSETGDDATTRGGRVRDPIASLPARTAVLQAELDLARRQLAGYTRTIRHQGEVLGEEIEPPAEGVAREALLSEIDRLERHLAAMTTPVVMPDLVLGRTAPASGSVPSSGTAPTTPRGDLTGVGS